MLATASRVAGAFQKNHPKRWKWRCEWLAQVGLEKLAGWLSAPFAFRVGEVLGGLAYYLMRSRRQIVLRNLRIAFYREKTLPELRQMAHATFRRTGANLFSALHTTGLGADRIDSVITVENPELVAEALLQSSGLVLLPCHMGNWEILTRIHRRLPPGHKNGAFYRPLNNPLLDARVLAQREAEGCRLFSKRDSFHQATGFLRTGGILGILADQRAGRQGELVRFFGRLTRASPLPSLLARRSKSGVLAMSLVTVSPGKWRVRYHLLNGPISTVNCMRAIEQAIRVNPLDYFWLQERWRVYLRPGHTICDWLGSDAMEMGTPHRALLWLAGVPQDWRLPEGWLHPDVVYEVVLASGQDRPSWLAGWEICHTVPTAGDTRGLCQALAKMDLMAALPVDYILTFTASLTLRKAAVRRSIPLVSLASASAKMSESCTSTDEIS